MEQMNKGDLYFDKIAVIMHYIFFKYILVWLTLRILDNGPISAGSTPKIMPLQKIATGLMYMYTDMKNTNERGMSCRLL